MRTRDKLAAELRAVAAKASPANAEQYEAFAVRAETGEFDDYATPSDVEPVEHVAVRFHRHFVLRRGTEH